MWKFSKISDRFFKTVFSLLCAFSVITLAQSVALNPQNNPFNSREYTSSPQSIKSENKANFAANSNGAANTAISIKNNDYALSLSDYGIPALKASDDVGERDAVLLARPFGIKIYTDGVMIINIDTVDTEKGNVSPGKLAGLKVGDLITSINGKKVYSNEDVAKIIENCGGSKLKFSIKRNSISKDLTVTPIKSYSSGKFKTGIWVRDSSAGIGTLTFYSPKYGVMAGLGHGVYDGDTAELLTVNNGQLVDAEILGVEKGKCGTPGELKGCFKNEVIGNINVNSEAGIYGRVTLNYDNKDIIKIADKSEIKVGEAHLISTVDGFNKPEKFSCRIEKIALNKNGTKNMVVKITDKRLIEKTGGIVQGMSGSPVIQNGKLVGAITHVFIDNPEMGYGIFAENMLETARSVEQFKNVG